MDKKKLEDEINSLYEKLCKEEIHVRNFEDIKKNLEEGGCETPDNKNNYKDIIDVEKQSKEWQDNYTEIVREIFKYYQKRNSEGELEGINFGRELFRTINKCIIHYQEDKNKYNSFCHYLNSNTKKDRNKSEGELFLTKKPNKIWIAIKSKIPEYEQLLKRKLNYNDLLEIGEKLRFSKKSVKKVIFKNYVFNAQSLDAPVGDDENKLGDLVEENQNFFGNDQSDALDENDTDYLLNEINNEVSKSRKNAQKNLRIAYTYIILEDIKKGDSKEWFYQKQKKYPFLELKMVDDYFDKFSKAKNHNETFSYTKREAASLFGITQQAIFQGEDCPYIKAKKIVNSLYEKIKSQEYK